jgi:hypothetical protein
VRQHDPRFANCVSLSNSRVLSAWSRTVSVALTVPRTAEKPVPPLASLATVDTINRAQPARRRCAWP